MRLPTRSTLLKLVKTSGAPWLVPTRLALGVMLLFPVDGSVVQLFAFDHAAPSAWQAFPTAVAILLRSIEVIAGISFIAGCGIRLTVYPTVALFAIRGLANCAGSFIWLREALNGIIAPRGDWGYGALYLGVALLRGDLLDAGSGRWSVDYWLSRQLKAASPSSMH